MSAVRTARYRGHAEIVEILLDAGADPDARQHGGWTPLMSAAANGDETAVDLLLEHGADAAAIAGERGHPEVAERYAPSPNESAFSGANAGSFATLRARGRLQERSTVSFYLERGRRATMS